MEKSDSTDDNPEGHSEPILRNAQSCNTKPPLQTPYSHRHLDQSLNLKSEFTESTGLKKFKVIMLGVSGVGKSAIILRFCENRFNSQGVTTCGQDISPNHVTVGNEKILISLWDTGGQERYDAITEAYFRNAHGIIMVYDVTERKSFSALRERWKDTIQELKREDKVVVLLIGNKTDLSPREVEITDGQKLATELRAEFFEVSAKSGDGADQAHMVLAKRLIQQEIAKLTRICKDIDRHRPNPIRKSSCCD